MKSWIKVCRMATVVGILATAKVLADDGWTSPDPDLVGGVAKNARCRYNTACNNSGPVGTIQCFDCTITSTFP